MTYGCPRDTAALFTAAFFTAVVLGTKVKLHNLAIRLLRAAMRMFGFPDFRYYALVNGIAEACARGSRQSPASVTEPPRLVARSPVSLGRTTTVVVFAPKDPRLTQVNAGSGRTPDKLPSCGRDRTMTIARMLCTLVVAVTVAGCETDIGRTQARGTLGAVTVGDLLGSRIGGGNDQLATTADNVANGQTAQFALPKPAPEGQAPAVQLPKELTFEYVYGSELEIPYVRNADLNSDVSDDSLILAPTLFGAITYRPTDWLEMRLEATLEQPFSVHEEEFVTLPNGSIQFPDPKPLSLLIDQAYVKLKLPNVPVEFTVGRRLFEDARLWLFDGELDAAIVTLKPGDFKIEASVSRENLFDLDLFANVPLGRINNYIVYAEYRGIEDHKLAGYWILRDDELGEEGSPQFMGVRAHGRPSDAFNYWTDLAFLRGNDELSRDFSGYAFEVGGTYRFLDLPLQPSVTLGYAYGSGDGNPDDNKNHEFRQTGLQSNEARFGGVTQFLAYGETLDPELSNLNIFTAGLGFRPAAGTFVDLVYHRYWLNEIAREIRGSAITAQMNQVDSRLSKDVGDGFDIVLGFRNLFGVRGLGVEVRAGLFFPGDAFLRDDGGVFSDADKGVSVLGVIFY